MSKNIIDNSNEELLQSIYTNEKARDSLLAFTKKEFSSENIEFLLSLNEMNPNEIYKMYIQNEKINLPGEIYDSLKIKVASGAELKKEDLYAAVVNIAALVCSDTLNRYKQSDIYQKDKDSILKQEKTLKTQQDDKNFKNVTGFVSFLKFIYSNIKDMFTAPIVNPIKIARESPLRNISQNSPILNQANKVVNNYKKSNQIQPEPSFEKAVKISIAPKSTKISDNPYVRLEDKEDDTFSPVIPKTSPKNKDRNSGNNTAPNKPKNR